MGGIRKASTQARALFAALITQPAAWRYGYELIKETGLQSGTLYPLLMRLEEQGLLEAEWREPVQRGRPPRHAYRLTSIGMAHARALLASDAGSAASRGLAHI